MTCKRFTDKLPFKITKGMLWSIVILLWSIVVWAAKNKYETMNLADELCAKSIVELKQDNAIIKSTLPKIERDIKLLLKLHLEK